MNLDLSADQELFLATTRRYLENNWPRSAIRELIANAARFERSLVEQGAELGWTSMLVPEEFGGGTISGRGVHDLAIVAEELGRSLFAGPILPTNVVAFALARSGSEELASAHLPKLAAGSETATWAAAEEMDNWAAESGRLQIARMPDGYRLNGVKGPVQDADLVDQLLVSARSSDGVTQLLVPSDAPGLSVEELDALDLTRRFCRLRFEDVEVPLEAAVGDECQGPDELELQLALALTLQCAETVGATSTVFDFTLEYVMDRKAFGRPIGSYQSLKHRLADTFLWLESAKAATEGAVDAVQSGVGAFEAASIAKAYVSDRCPVILRECLQFHGGIGYTWEHDLHLYLRRVDSNAAIYGGPIYHRDRLTSAVGF